MQPQPPEWHTGKTVAVVGSGPAGLAAAQQLTRAGHTVAVFERAEEPGGLLRYGIPEFKMEKAVLDRRIRQMKDEGTNFRCGVEVGVDDHRRGAARSATTRSCWPSGRRSAVTCRCRGGSWTASTRRWSSCRRPTGWRSGGRWRTRSPPTGKHVVIIGGGDTGADCLGTAIRQGAESIVQLEIMPTPPDERPENQPWPTYPMIYRVSSAHEEAGDRVYSVSTSSSGDERGRVGVAELSEVVFEGGKLVPVEGTEREIPAELVLLAMGFTGPETDTVVAPARGVAGRARERRPGPELRHRRRGGLRLR